MKKLVLAMLVAAMAVPAFAVVNINATDEGNGVLKLWYECTEGEIIRGIALRIEADGNATIANNGAATVLALWEIDGKSFGFNTYMDYAFTVESDTPGFYDIDLGHPLAKADERGELDSFPAGLFSVSMGALDQLGEQAGVGSSGELMTIKFDLTGDAVISIAADTLRGGVVGDGVEVVAVQPTQWLIDGGVVEEVVCSALAKTTAGTNIDQTRVNASRVETFTAAASSNVAGEIEYSFDFGDGNWTAWGAASQTKTFVYGGAGVVAANDYSFNVKVKARNAATLVESAEYGPIVMVSEPVKSTIGATQYGIWAAAGRPNCWAFPRNCRGDANGGSTGLGANRTWVTVADLNILAAAFNKVEADLLVSSFGGFPGVCADFNRGSTGLGANRTWVTVADLNVLAQYFNKVVAEVPVCEQTQYHYWTGNL
ncbi:MAG: hypothetical protein GXY41_00535 [Phycisphaerae bacterium]|nr:hypothetical protein [Phycisphaerae bacterium]